MTVLNFPSTVGQPTDGSFTYTENGVIYTWNGSYWAANNADNLDTRYVNVGGDTMTGDLTVPSLNGGPLAGFRNQIINGNYAIDQRTNGSSTTVGNDGGYGLDRWFISAQSKYSRNGSSGGSVPEVFGTAMRLEGPTTTTFTRQMVEFPFPGIAQRFSTGTTWTFSFWTTINSTTDVATSIAFADEIANLTNAVQVSGGNKILSPTGVTVTSTDGTVFYQYSYTFTIAVKPLSTNKGMAVNIVALNNAGADWKIANAQLEPGPVATPFEHRPVGTELALCQRYYQNSGTIFGYVLTRSTDIGQNGTTYNMYRFLVEMRIPPTFSTSGTWNDNAGYAGTPNASSLRTSHFRVQSTKSGPAGNIMFLQSANDGVMHFDAEL